MSLRSALTVALLVTAFLAVTITGAAGIASVVGRVRQEAQQRVNQDLKIARVFYRRGLRDTQRALAAELPHLSLEQLRRPAALAALRRRLGFTLLNLCAVDGAPLAGSHAAERRPVPLQADAVLRRARGGRGAAGTVSLTPARLAQEAGVRAQSLALIGRDGQAAPALFWWTAQPLVDGQGRIAALLYGGKALTRNFALVDRLQRLTFGTERYEGKPLGTVTVFADDVRAATNVLDPDGRRAIGTRVSAEVRERVLRRGQHWLSRAFVVDRWYLSAYEPLTDPDGSIIGMLYVGLLEGPYEAARWRMIERLGAVVLLVLLLAGLASWLLVRHITRPLSHLDDAVGAITAGDLGYALPTLSSYREVRTLQDSLETMRRAVRDRDRERQQHNKALESANEALARANANYMQTLGFVTHELKSPLAAMQSLIDVVVGGYVGEIPAAAQAKLVRVKRNAEELQDMVKNYLDLSRAERGELAVKLASLDFIEAVVGPCVQQTQPLFDSRKVTLEIDAPAALTLQGDAELLRIALTNYLSNAAKYAREGGHARLEVSAGEGLRVTVWNEGAGFAEAELGQLFQKFSRLRNADTRDKRGSGLGLFLCRDIVEQHGGKVWAESEPGHWARFGFRLPLQRSKDV